MLKRLFAVKVKRNKQRFMGCYFCGKNNLKVLRNRLRNNIERNVLQCQDCKLIYLEPKSNLRAYYEGDYRKLHSPIIGKALTSREIFEMYLPHQKSRIEALGEKINSNSKVLEIGCSAGHFLYSIKDKVRECVGVELNKENAEFVNKELGICVYNDSIENLVFPEEYFDAIAAFHVFEHIDNPLDFLKNLSKYLKPDGVIFLEVPNTNDALMSLYKLDSFADFWYIEPHSFFYTPETLKMMLEKGGFSGVVRTTQSYSFVNHINWALRGEPQASFEIGYSVPKLVLSDDVDPAIKSEFNDWMKKVDEEYRKMLEKNNVAGNIIFIGKKL